MPRPALSILAIASQAVELAAGVGFELVHDSFGSNLPPRWRAHDSILRAPPGGSSHGVRNASAGPPAPLPGLLGRARTALGAFVDAPPGRVVDRAPTAGCQPDCDADPPSPIVRRVGVRRNRRM